MSEPFQVEAHGAAVRVNYACTQVITGVTLNGLASAETADPSTCLLEAGENHAVTLQMTVYNDGDYRAEGVKPSVTLPPGVEVLSTRPQAASVTTSTVTWGAEDLAPGGFRLVELTAFIPVNEAGGIAFTAVQRLAEVIHRSDGEFVDTFNRRLIQV